MTSYADVEVLVFDILGTMVEEATGVRRGLRTLVPEVDDARTSDLVDVWQRHVGGQQAEILAGRRPYASSTVIDLEAAALVAAEVGIGDPDAVHQLAAYGQQPDPWPDSVSGLARLGSQYRVVGLSNASRPALTRLNAHAGLRWHQVLSGEEAQSYKPDPAVYRLAIHNAGCPPDRLVMVAAHAWDLRGAQAAGMRTAYVERPTGDPPGPSDSFDLHAESLDDLALGLAAP